jgi:hypothetical protein
LQPECQYTTQGLSLTLPEDSATLMVAKRIIEAQGERDPERLAAATVEALAK